MEKKIDKLNKIVEKLLQFRNVVKVKDQKNLWQTLRKYPNKGMNFKVSERFWPLDRYYIVKAIRKLNDGKVKIYGDYYENSSK